jgi:hypothetical protein
MLWKISQAHQLIRSITKCISIPLCLTSISTTEVQKMADILNDPLKLAMLVILIALEIPAAICLAVWWKKAGDQCE